MNGHGGVFVGRLHELGWIRQRLADPACRLITLIGPGGSGKTRLAIQASMEAEASGQFDDGVCMVELAGIDSSRHLAHAMSAALGLSLHGPDEPMSQVIDALRGQNLLLVLDNLESPTASTDPDTARLLSALLEQAPAIKALITSRERLYLRDEWVFPVDGLSFPAAAAGTDTSEAAETDAVALFLDCARQANPNLDMRACVGAARAICSYVEGMPLAIVIAASWLRAMSPDAVLAHLTHDIDFLTSPLRNIPARHASLRAVFDGSWELLSDAERLALAELTIFRGDFDIAAAHAVAGASPRIIASLVDKSLLRMGASGRYRLHQLIRQYAAEKLGDGVTPAADRHLAHFLECAENAERALYGPAQIRWFDTLELEYVNLDAALAHAAATGRFETGLRLAGALGWFWQLRIHLRVGSDWYAVFLNNPAAQTVSAGVRAKALHRASEVETQLGNAALARSAAEQAIAIARDTHDQWNLAWGLAAIGLWSKHDTLWLAPLDEALTLFRAIDDPWGISHALRRLALFLVHTGDVARAVALSSESLVLARAAGATSAVAWSLFALAFSSWYDVDLRPQAIGLLRECLPMFRETRDANGLAMALDLLSGLEFIGGDMAQAVAHTEENLLLALERTWQPPLTSENCLAVSALLLWRRGDRKQVTPLIASIARLFDITQPASPYFLFGPQISTLLAHLPPPDASVDPLFTRQQTLDSAIRILGVPANVSASGQADDRLVEPLSRREREVLDLLAAGQSNAEIARTLCVSTGTVKAHTRNIYGKLNVDSRTRAVAIARMLGLLDR